MIHTSSKVAAAASEGGDNNDDDGKDKEEEMRRVQFKLITAAGFMTVGLTMMMLATDTAANREEARVAAGPDGPPKYEGPVNWNTFYGKMLMAGEVERIEVVALPGSNVRLSVC